MKYYTLTAIVNGQKAKLKREVFSSRTEAINYMFDYYEDHYIYNLELQDEHIVGEDKHCVEYVCNYQNRFIIARA